MDFISDSKIVIDALEKFYNETIKAQKPVINQQRIEDVVSDLKLNFFAEKGGLSGEALEGFLKCYLGLNTRLHHPGYLGHQCAAPHYSASLGTFINAFTNNVAAVYEMGPASAAIEHFLIQWMLSKIGWDKAENQAAEGGGVLVDGGSIANLTALIIARSHCYPEVWTKGNPSGLSILLPQESHYSLTKAAGILGIGNESMHFLDLDDRGAILPDRLPYSLKKALQMGHRPIALVANACNTPVGIYDPLDEIADFCNENKLWLHVDGAHGASALLSEKHRHRLKGLERANSLVWDAHKLLQAPSLCAALLVRDRRQLDAGLHVGDNASYLFHDKHQPGFDSLHRTLETTKSGLGEKLFFVLGALGEKGLAGFIDRQYELTLLAYNYISNLPDFQCPVRPQSNILCFKYKGTDSDQLYLRKELIREGNFYLTSTLFKGVRYLRLVFMSPETRMEHIKKLTERIPAILASQRKRTG